MPISHKDLWEYAWWDFNQEPETRRRAAISRGWYSLYHLVDEFLKQNGYKLPSSGGHEKVVTLIKETNKRIEEAGISNDDLAYVSDFVGECKAKRKEADYTLRVDISLKLAEEFIEYLDGCYERLNKVIKERDVTDAMVAEAELQGLK